MAILFSFLLAIGLCGALVSSAFTIYPVSNVFQQKAPFLFSGWRPLEASFWMWITIIAICTFLALSLMTKAYQIAKTSYAAIYEYAYLLSAGIFSWAFWNVTPNIMGFGNHAYSDSWYCNCACAARHVIYSDTKFMVLFPILINCDTGSLLTNENCKR